MDDTTVYQVMWLHLVHQWWVYIILKEKLGGSENDTHSLSLPLTTPSLKYIKRGRVAVNYKQLYLYITTHTVLGHWTLPVHVKLKMHFKYKRSTFNFIFLLMLFIVCKLLSIWHILYVFHINHKLVLVLIKSDISRLALCVCQLHVHKLKHVDTSAYNCIVLVSVHNICSCISLLSHPHSASHGTVQS